MGIADPFSDAPIPYLITYCISFIAFWWSIVDCQIDLAVHQILSGIAKSSNFSDLPFSLFGQLWRSMIETTFCMWRYTDLPFSPLDLPIYFGIVLELSAMLLHFGGAPISFGDTDLYHILSIFLNSS